MPSEDIISLTEFKNDAAGWIKRLQTQPPVVLTQNGRGTAVVQSYESWQQTQATLAMLQIVAAGEADIGAGRVTPQAQVFSDLRRELEARVSSPKSPRRTRG